MGNKAVKSATNNVPVIIQNKEQTSHDHDVEIQANNDTVHEINKEIQQNNAENVSSNSTIKDVQINKDKLTVFGLIRESQKLLPNITRYNIPDLVIYCILSYYEDDGEYFRICDENKVRLEYDNRKAMTLTDPSSVYGSHLIYINEKECQNIYSWTFHINKCYLIAIGLVDGNCVKTSYDFTNKNNSYAYYSDSNVFFKVKLNHVKKWHMSQTFGAGDIIKMVLNLQNKPAELMYYKNGCRITHQRNCIDFKSCLSLRMAICLYNHQYDGGQSNSIITLKEFHIDDDETALKSIHVKL